MPDSNILFEKKNCSNQYIFRLWTVVRSSLPKQNQAVLELICLMLREFFSQKYELKGVVEFEE